MNPRHLFVLLLAAPLATPAFASAQASLPAVDALFTAFDKPDSAGAVVAVEQAGKLLHLRAYGAADVEARKPLEATTPIYLASVSKQFTAACIAKLAADGRLDLDAGIRRILATLPEYCAPVTVRHLVHHRSGLRDFFELMSLARRDLALAVTPAEVLDLIGRQRGLDFAPGSECRYSNTNYFLIAEIVRAVAGKSLRDYAQEQLFGPLGMQHSCFVDAPGQVAAAVGHTSSAAGYAPRRTAFALPGSGGMYSTAEDLLRWLGNFDTGKVGGKEFVARLVTAPVLAAGQRRGPDLGDYAFGIQVRERQGRRIEFHQGGSFGYKTCVLRIPAERLHVVVLGNAGDLDADAKAFAIADAVLGAPPAGDAPAGNERPATGFRIHQDATGDLAILNCKADGKATLATLSWKVALQAESATELASRTAPVPVKVTTSPTELRLSIGDEPLRTFRALELGNVAAAELEALTGAWHFEELGADLRLQVASGRLRLEDRGMELKVPPFLPVSRDLLLSDAGVLLTVERDAAGAPAAIVVSTGRARGLRATRARG